MSVSQPSRGHARPAVSPKTKSRDTSAGAQTLSHADLEVVAGQGVSQPSRGHVGTHPALPATQRVPGRGGLIKTPSRTWAGAGRRGDDTDVDNNNMLDNKMLDKLEFPYEVWRPVADFAGYYEVSSSGRVRSVCRTVPVTGQKPRRLRSWVLSPSIRPRDGRRHVTLCVSGKLSTRTVDQLMRDAGFRP